MSLEALTDAERNALAELEDAAAFASRPRTLKEIGDRLGYSRERVRQLQNQGLAKMAAALRQRSKDPRGAWLDGKDDGVPPAETIKPASPWF